MDDPARQTTRDASWGSSSSGSSFTSLPAKRSRHHQSDDEHVALGIATAWLRRAHDRYRLVG